MPVISGTPGVGDYYTSSEYTSPETNKAYVDAMAKLRDLFNKKPLTETDYQDLEKAMDDLIQLAKATTGKDAMTATQVENLKQVFDILASAGIQPGQKLDSKTGLELMKVLQGFQYSVPDQKAPVDFVGFMDIVLGRTKGADLTLQSMFFTVFLKTGYDYFTDKLEQLSEAIKTNEKVLTELNNVLKLRNKLVQPSNGGVRTPLGEWQWKFDPSNPFVPPKRIWVPDWSKYLNLKHPDGPPYYGRQYTRLEAQIKCTMDTELLLKQDATTEANDPDMKLPKVPNIDTTPQNVQDLLNLRKNLKAQREELIKAGVIPGQGEDNLADKLDKVIKDLDGLFKEADDYRNKYNLPEDMSQWNQTQQENYANKYGEYVGKAAFTYLLDGQDKTAGSGKYADNLQNAMTAGETLNENQKDELNKVKYVFEQFEKIAQAVMAALNDVVKKFAAIKAS